MTKYNFDEIVERRGTGCVKWDEAQEGVIPMWVADMDFSVAQPIQEAIQHRAAHPVFGYTFVSDDYYEAVVSWFKRRHDWAIAREHILYTTGVVPAMSCAIKALTMPGEKVLILSPDYNCFFSSVRNNGCEVLETALLWNADNDRFVVDWQDFEAKCADEKTTAFLLCNPHNPTGRVWTREELQQMADICQRNGVRVISDEIHCELVMPGHRFCPMGTVDKSAVILNSPSKSFNIAGLQTANIICTDAATRRRIDRAININEVCDLNPFGPVALIAAYNDSEQWIDDLNQYIWQNYQTLCDFAARHIPGWKVMPMEGTYLAWVDCSACCKDVATYCNDIMNNAKVWLNPGTMYGPESGKGYVRINLACPRSVLLEALNRIAAHI
jgi:cystathionine beta-lyase